MKPVEVRVTRFGARNGPVKNDQILHDAMANDVWYRVINDIPEVISDSIIVLHGTHAIPQVPNDNWAHFTPGWSQIKDIFHGVHRT
jgi:hypothetical protein